MQGKRAIICAMNKRDNKPYGQMPSTVRPVSYGGSRHASGRTPKTNALPPATGATGAAAYSRANYTSKKKHSKGLIALLVVMILALLVGGVAFGGYLYLGNISNQMHEGVDEELEAVLTPEEEVQPDEPFYMLIMGIDKSEERANSAAFAGDTFRSDSMILTRVDPQQKTVTLVSIERDTYVDIEGYGPNKINAAAAYGGAALTVKTIEEFAGVDISHYVAIDFDGFKEAVDALGGIEVDVPMTIDDPQAGGRVEAGEQTLNGDQALILCRSRHAYDNYGSGDYYRMANQRMVMGAIAKKLLASDPVTMANTISSMAGYITTDFNVEDIVSIATQMQGMDTDEDIYSAMNPTTSTMIDGIYYEICDTAAWQEMMKRVDEGLPPYEDEDRNKNDGGGLDGTVTGVQEYGAENAELSDSAAAALEDSLEESAGSDGSSGDSSGGDSSGGTDASYYDETYYDDTYYDDAYYGDGYYEEGYY